MISNIQTHVDLQPFNTFCVKAQAAYFTKVTSVEQCQQLLRRWQEQPLFILGGGSNILLTHDLSGLVIKIEIKGIHIVKENSEHIWLKLGAGESWHDVVMHCVEQGFQGIENLALIPGTVGAAPIQNIGAYGVELKETFDSLNALHRKTRALHVFNNAECQFDYRDSVFKQNLKNQFVIMDVTLKLNKPPAYQFQTHYQTLQEKLPSNDVTLKNICDTIIRIRQEKLPDPRQTPNAGSFFKNPIIDNEQLHTLLKKYADMPYFSHTEYCTKVPAGWLIEQCGLKGKKLGKVGTYEKQALVIVNREQANGKEILHFAEHIIKTVYEKFAISLALEVNIV